MTLTDTGTLTGSPAYLRGIETQVAVAVDTDLDRSPAYLRGIETKFKIPGISKRNRLQPT